MLFHSPKRTLKKLLREREEMYWKNRFDMDYLKSSEPEVFAMDILELGKKFDEVEGKLLDIQKKYGDKEIQIKGWNLPAAKEEEKMKEMREEKAAEQKPFVEEIRPLKEKIDYHDQIKALYEKCEEKDLELRKYLIILKWKLKVGDYDYPVITGEEFLDDLPKSTHKIGHNFQT